MIYMRFKTLYVSVEFVRKVAGLPLEARFQNIICFGGIQGNSLFKIYTAVSKHYMFRWNEWREVEAGIIEKMFQNIICFGGIPWEYHNKGSYEKFQNIICFGGI